MLKKTISVAILLMKVLCGVVVVWVIIYKFVNPPITYLMIREGKTLSKNEARKWMWIDFKEIPEHVKCAVVWAEDGAFYQHKGVKPSMFMLAASQYWNKTYGEHMTGYSTITQQTAKNVFLYPARTPLRKILELPFVFFMELFWGKDRILEVYMNVIECGENVFGIEAASYHYYKKSCRELTPKEASQIASILINPKIYQPEKFQKKVESKASMIQQRFYKKRLLEEALKRKQLAKES